jgi:hypothetical protein
MITTRLGLAFLIALCVSTANGRLAAADETQKPVPGISIADPNAGWVEIAPDATLAPSQDTNVASDSVEPLEQ